MEFQRHHKPYLSTVPGASPLTSAMVTNSPLPAKTILSAATTSSTPYTGPIVSARTSTFADFTSRFAADNLNSAAATTNSVPASPLTNTSSSAPYTSSYSNNFNFPTSNVTSRFATSTYTSPLSTDSLYTADLSKYSSGGTADSDSSRPYVSAIRKRRTLFDEPGMEAESTAQYTNSFHSDFASPYLSSFAKTVDSDAYSGRQRPLSIVSEETGGGGYHPLTRSLSAKGDSRLLNNDTTQHTINQLETSSSSSSNNSFKLNKPPIKKSNSTVSATNPKPSQSHCQSEAGSSGTTSPISVPQQHQHQQPKLRSTVFDRLAALNNTSLNASQSTKLSYQQKSSLGTSNLNLNNIEQPLEKKRDSSVKPNAEFTAPLKSQVIKDQNEIAIVTSMTPATSKKDLSQYSSTNSAATLNRIRSLDSKSREKLRNKDFGAKKPASPVAPVATAATGKATGPVKTNEPVAASLSSARRKSTTQLPPAVPTSPTPQSPPPQTAAAATASSFSSNSNPAFKLNNSDAGATRTDVFERLSKRTNSLKNLANNNNNNLNTNA